MWPGTWNTRQSRRRKKDRPAETRLTRYTIQQADGHSGVADWLSKPHNRMHRVQSSNRAETDVPVVGNIACGPLGNNANIPGRLQTERGRACWCTESFSFGLCGGTVLRIACVAYEMSVCEGGERGKRGYDATSKR